MSLGVDSWLYSSYSFIHFASRQSDAIIIGDNTGIYDGTFFDLGENGSLSIGDYCTVVGAVFCCDGHVQIDDYALIAHEVVFANGSIAIPAHANIHLPEIQKPDRAYRIRAGDAMPSIRVRTNAWIGAKSILLEGADIGENSIVAASTVVSFAVPSNSLVYGNPARIRNR
jgi:acetyltransferase-like isoleucine patch superfamily enzyme